jgi:hypothetical protein
MGFIDEIGLKEHLSPTRANGLVSMIKNIKMYALAFNSIKKKLRIGQKVFVTDDFSEQYF